MKIKMLHLLTQNLSRQFDFYKNTLQLEAKMITEDKMEVIIGTSKIVFMESSNFTPYHFALNIPCNQIHQAHDWLTKRVSILKEGEMSIHDFDFWEAEAVYFYDADQNIVEFIARRPLQNARRTIFSAESLLDISEIGIPLDSIAPVYNQIHTQFSIPIFSGSIDQFCAMGDDEGLFILIDRTQRKWFPINDEAYSSPFSVAFEWEGKSYEFTFDGNQIIPLNPSFV